MVIGNGNVALDVARMLVLAPRSWRRTDTADHALEVLARSRVREVVVVGRRGPAQAAFTNPELLELGELADADVVVDADELERALAVHDEAPSRTRPRGATWRSCARTPRARPRGSRKRIVLRFLLSPAELLAEARAASARCELVRNELVADAEGALRARPDRARSGRRSRRGWCSARSAIAVRPCPTCRSTSAAA